MTFKDKENKLYVAVRNTYGYNDNSDELVDFIMDLCDHYEELVGGENE